VEARGLDYNTPMRTNFDEGLAALYRRMKLIRRFEEIAEELYDAKEIPSHVHQYIGQEAVAVGLCAALRPDDVITSTHRGHGHALAKGADPGRMLAELMGRVTGQNRGRGGTMHVADLSLGIYGANGIVGAGAPMAVGAAKTFRDRGEDRVAAPFFGDGAANQGVLLESFNLAAIWKLPVIFVCENNGYAVSTAIDGMVKGRIFERAAAFGMAAEEVDGMDVRAMRDAAARAVARARAGEGPTFLECRTYRFRGHFTAERGRLAYRSDEELAAWLARDPLARARLEAADRAAIDRDVEEEMTRAVAFARAGAWPDPAGAHELAYSRAYPDFPARGLE
jgi:pyruvate dehydrogenase E1 component alpha subunit